MSSFMVFARRVLLISLFSPFVLSAMGRSQSCTCSGPNAPPDKTSSGQEVFVGQGQQFHVNINVPNLDASQVADIQAGINSWVGTSGISFVFDNSPPGPGVISVAADNTIPSDGFGTWSTQASAAPNQIDQGTILLRLGYAGAPCAAGPCLGYSEGAPNSRAYLSGLLAHETGHVLGLTDTPDSANPRTQTSNSVMGAQVGTNNNGDGSAKPAPTSNAPTCCDKQTVAAQTSKKGSPPPSGGGGGHHPISYEPPPNTGGGGGGSCYSSDEWDDSSATLTSYTVC